VVLDEMQSYGIEGDVVRAAAIALLPYPTIPVGAINKFMRNFGIPAVTCVRVRAEIIKVGAYEARRGGCQNNGICHCHNPHSCFALVLSLGQETQWQMMFCSEQC
jgi:hypothetical protein